MRSLSKSLTNQAPWHVEPNFNYTSKSEFNPVWGGMVVFPCHHHYRHPIHSHSNPFSSFSSKTRPNYQQSTATTSDDHHSTHDKMPQYSTSIMQLSFQFSDLSHQFGNIRLTLIGGCYFLLVHINNQLFCQNALMIFTHTYE